MAKTESTAVNDLIASMQGGAQPPAKDPGDDLFAPQPAAKPARMTSTIPPMRGAGEVSPLPRKRAPHGTSQHQLPNAPPPVRVSTAPPARMTTIPPLARTPAPQARPSQPPTRRSAPPPTRASRPAPQRTSQPPGTPVAAPFEARPQADRTNPLVARPSQRPITIDAPGDAVHADHWFEASRAVDKIEKLDQSWGTMAVPRTTPPARSRKLIAPLAVLALAGVGVGGYLALRGDSTPKHSVPPTSVVTAPAPAPKPELPPVPPPPAAESINAATATAGGSQPEPPTKQEAVAPAAAPAPAPAAAPAAAAAPAPAPAAAAADTHEIETTRGVVELVDVRLDSRPAGATVMLVDNGKTSFLGTTPVAASLDPSRSYDIVFTAANHPTQMVHVDPTKTHRVELVLGHHGAPGKVTTTPLTK
ncbi:MAG: hypothetical protein ACM31C_15380 [Acidobacteriota bacterium]